MLLAFSLFAACGEKENDGKNNMDNNNNAADKNPGSVTNDKDKNDGDKTPLDDMADGVGDVANGLANGAEDVWDGLMDMFGMDNAPKTTAGTDEVFARDYGIDDGLLDSYTLRTPEGDNNASEFFIAKVKEGKMSDVEAALEKRKQAIADKWKDSTDESLAYAREPVIIKSGNYTMLAVHSDLEQARAEFEKLTKESK